MSNEKTQPLHTKVNYLMKKKTEPKVIYLLTVFRRVNNIMDSNFKRLEYVRYDNEFVILVTGSIHEATPIKNNAKELLQRGGVVWNLSLKKPSLLKLQITIGADILKNNY